MIHQDIREQVAKLLRLDLATAGPDELAKLDDATALAEGSTSAPEPAGQVAINARWGSTQAHHDSTRRWSFGRE
ncbi:hypothetical protein SAMN04490239_1588 [Rhodococcus koreensis]|uniref:Uncharacterized protein n=2 Tax=Rhodococcus koreensis TaxID=99653 RepID=A0A1H4M3E7_9NOCA|nr:hypothetical protein SAMN04490239_1588 [Rhodococcus koreensis]